VDTHRAAGGNFGHASEGWTFKLSTLNGTVSLQSNWGGGNAALDPEIIVHDLTARVDPMADEVVRRRFGSRLAAFGEAQQTFAKWDAGEPLWLTATQLQGGDTAEQRARSPEQYARDLAAAAKELGTVAKIVATATGRVVGKPGARDPEIASASRPRALKTRLRSSGEDPSWSNVLSAQLDHLPHQVLPNWRPGKSDAELQAVNEKLKRLYDPKVALFTFDRSVENRRYNTPAFFDPLKGPPPEAAEDARHVSQINAKGAVHVYRCENGDEVLSGAYVDDELVIMNRDGYFEGTEDAAGYVEMTLDGIPGRQLLSQYFGVLHKPGVALKTLAGAATLAPPRLIAPPTLRRLAAAGSAEGVRLDASSTAGLAYVHLYAAGRPLRRIDLSGSNAVVAVTESARPEFGHITAVAIDTHGIVSTPLSLDAGLSRPGHGAGKLWGLFVGIDSYPLLPNVCGLDGRSPCTLTLAAADARRLAHAVGQSRLYRDHETALLIDKDASRSAVLARLAAMVGGAGSEDTIVVSFAGHGLRDDDALWLVLSSTSLDDLPGTSLAFADVATRLKRARARVACCSTSAMPASATASRPTTMP